MMRILLMSAPVAARCSRGVAHAMCRDGRGFEAELAELRRIRMTTDFASNLIHQRRPAMTTTMLAVAPSPTARVLPHLADRLFLTDGGLETTLIFHDGVDLPCFASIDLMRTEDGRRRLVGYFERYIAIAKAARAGFVLESATWRASPDWAEGIGVSQGELDDLNRRAIEMLHRLRAEHETSDTPMLVSGCVGPRGDGYRPDAIMSAEEAQAYHARQIGVFGEAGVDLVSAITMTNTPEAIGVARAAAQAGLPAVISFTVETDGRLPTGQSLRQAIEAVDDATGGGPAYYMVNCAHPSHFGPALSRGEEWVRRIRGLRANASRLSHAELDACTELDDGDPAAFGAEHRALTTALPHLAVLGGCCGTDHRHVGAIAAACAGASRSA